MSKKASRMQSWSRLRPVELDPLEAIGLPSKGDKRLLDEKTQEKYYARIMQKYMTFCGDAGKRDELLRRFASLELDANALPRDAASPSGPPVEALQSPANTKALSDVMMALRKLREGIVASKRVDDFSVQAYLFCIRLSVLIKNPESYHAAILYLLRHLHPLCPLTTVEFREVVSYLVLDTACRRRDLGEAYWLRHQYSLRDAKVDSILHALTHDNWVRFRALKLSVDGHRARLLDFAESDVRMRTLKAFGRTYLSVDLGYLEAMTDSRWDDLTKRDGVGWELEEDNKVLIRKVRAK